MVSPNASRDEAKHKGHLTKHEQRKINRHLNRTSDHIKDQKELPVSATAK